MSVDDLENGKNDKKRPNDSDRPTRPEAQTTDENGQVDVWR